MARIAEDLLLLLLDNPEEQPQLDRAPLGRVLAGALIADLAFDCRVRPALPDEALPAGHLTVLEGPVPVDPAVRPAWALLRRQPITPADAITAIRKHSEDDVLDQLLRSGQIHQLALTTHRLRRNHYRWPIKNRGRAAVARADLLGTLFEERRPQPVTAAVTCLLHGVHGLEAVLSLNDAGVRAVDDRVREIADGGWVDDSDTAQVNLSLTLGAVLPALA